MAGVVRSWPIQLSYSMPCMPFYLLAALRLEGYILESVSGCVSGIESGHLPSVRGIIEPFVCHFSSLDLVGFVLVGFGSTVYIRLVHLALEAVTTTTIENKPNNPHGNKTESYP